MSKKAQYDKEDCLKSLHLAAKELGHSPDVRLYIDGGYLPCYSTIQSRFGGWKRALEEAGLSGPPRERARAAAARRVEKTRHTRGLLRQEAMEIMKGDLTKSLALDEIADRMGTTPAKLRRAFLADSGSTPGAKLTEIRVERAATLLRSQDQSVYEVAAKVGYTYNGLIRMFSKIMNETPSHYKRRLRMERAAKLLVEQPQLTTKEVARQTGPIEGHDFNKMFHRFYGISPLHYRKMMLTETDAEIAARKGPANAEVPLSSAQGPGARR